jgi:hypothetical protein
MINVKPVSSGLDLSGFWTIICRDKFGAIKWKEYIWNKIVYQALDDVLGVYFAGGTAYSNHYIFLYDSDDTPLDAWTYANGGTGGSDYNEFTDYDEANRPTWQKGSVSSRSITNSSNPATFTASSAVDTTIYGAGMVNVSTKGDSASGSGILFCATRFGTPRPYIETEEIKIVYTITATSV